MTNYIEVSINISPRQQHSIANAIRAKSRVRLKFTNSQLQQNTNSKMLLTKSQILKIEKAIASGKGTTITLSLKQLNAMKTGGFLPVLLGALVSSLAPVLFNRLFPEKHGDGIHTNDLTDYQGDGIRLPVGSGVIIPGNGDNSQYHITGQQISYLPDQGGSGVLLPGTTQRIKKQKALGLPSRKKNKMLGMGYIAPNSETYNDTYQYLE